VARGAERPPDHSTSTPAAKSRSSRPPCLGAGGMGIWLVGVVLWLDTRQKRRE
jgi:hypothetical protein